jgi:AcrR family transcriptional regulator
MPFLLPDPRPRVISQQATDDATGVGGPWLTGMDLEATEVLGADVAVLVGTDQPHRCSMGSVDRAAVETFGEEHTVGQRVLEQNDRPEAVESAEHEVGDVHPGRERGRDHLAVELGERDSLPPQVGGRPTSDTVEVGGQLLPWEVREVSERHVELLDHRSANADRGIGRGQRGGSAEVGAEAWKSLDPALAGRQRPGRRRPFERRGHHTFLLADRWSVTDYWSVSRLRAVTVKRLRTRQAEATRELLVSVARQRFTEQGYAATSIEDIVQRAGVAKGALYHHFTGKDALFRAVYEAVQADAVSAVMAAALEAREPWAGVRAGLSAFLDACLDPTFRRVVVLDSVSVLQHEVWEGGIEHVELPMLRTVLTPLASNVLPGVAVDPLAHVALGGLYGAALFIARSPNPNVARDEVDVVLDTLIDGLRARVGQPEQ